MKRILVFGLFLAVMGLYVGCAPKGEDPQKMLDAAKALDQQLIEAFNNQDVDAMMATYWNNPELVSFPVGEMETKGWEAVKKATQETFTQMPGATLKVLETNYKVAGDMVLGWGTWRVTTASAEGDSMVINGRYSGVMAKRDGNWVYIFDHTSVPMTPPGPPAEK